MRRDALELIRCPACRAERTLNLTVESENEREVREGSVTCSACGESRPIREGIVDLMVDPPDFVRREAEGLDFPPYPGNLGKRIWENVSKEAWAQWLKQQTMLVNENRLNLADPKARKYLMEQTERHFFGTGADTASGYVPPQK